VNSFNEAAGQIFELFDTINSRGEYRALTARFWSEVSKGKALSGKTSRKLAFEIFWKIYDGMDISNQKDRDRAEEQFRNLLRFNNVRNFRQPIQSAIHDLASDLVLGRKFRFTLKLRDFTDFEHLIETWQSTGLRLDPGEITRNVASKMVKNGTHRNEKSLRRVVDILGVYSNADKIFVPFFVKSEKYWASKRSKPELKQEIIKRANRRRDVVDGRHTRDSRLVLLLKRYYPKECKYCGRKGRDIIIEISHRIPLNLGVKNFGFDSPINMEPLCRECHKRHEKIFTRKYDALDSEGQNEMVRKIHESQLKASEWRGHIDKAIFDVDLDSIAIANSAISKCTVCLKRFNNTLLCKSCGSPTLPLGHAAFAIKS
jgi:5-methylcytosine-specific restriction endonuclease McrA